MVVVLSATQPANLPDTAIHPYSQLDNMNRGDCCIIVKYVMITMTRTVMCILLLADVYSVLTPHRLLTALTLCGHWLRHDDYASVITITLPSEYLVSTTTTFPTSPSHQGLIRLFQGASMAPSPSLLSTPAGTMHFRAPPRPICAHSWPEHRPAPLDATRCLARHIVGGRRWEWYLAALDPYTTAPLLWYRSILAGFVLSFSGCCIAAVSR